jgi:FkbM family methyltransferase
VVRDRRMLSASERRARRERVRRRKAWAQATQTNDILTLTAHDRTIRLYDAEGKIPACWRAGKPYERPLLEHIYEQGFTGLAIDAGANIGNHTLWLAGICGLDVVAFEPLKHAELIRNVALNNLGDRVRVEPVALGAVEGTALHVAKGRLDPTRGTLPVRTLDSFDLQDVALIKADVEGMESAVLAGGGHTIRDQRPVIFAEEWGTPEHDAVAAVLEPWGYRMTRTFHGKGSATPVGRWDPM